MSVPRTNRRIFTDIVRAPRAETAARGVHLSCDEMSLLARYGNADTRKTAHGRHAKVGKARTEPVS
jgi:hypothetical protein